MSWHAALEQVDCLKRNECGVANAWLALLMMLIAYQVATAAEQRVSLGRQMRCRHAASRASSCRETISKVGNRAFSWE